MKLGLGLSLTGMQRRRDTPFAPAVLFANGEQGAWYDPSDLSTVFTDTAGTTPAAVGDPVARINDKSGRGNHATQATAAARPILRQTAGGLYYLEFDGVDDELACGVFVVSENWHQTIGVMVTGRAGVRTRLWATSALGTAANAMGSYLRTDVVEDFYGALRIASGSSFIAFRRGDYAIGESFVGEAYHGDNTIFAQVNGGIIASDAADDNATSSSDLTLGGPTPVRVYQGVFIKRGLTISESDDLRGFVADKTGVTL